MNTSLTVSKKKKKEHYRYHKNRLNGRTSVLDCNKIVQVYLIKLPLSVETELPFEDLYRYLYLSGLRPCLLNFCNDLRTNGDRHFKSDGTLLWCTLLLT